MYEGLRIDYGGDSSLLADLNASKAKLHSFYKANYRTASVNTLRAPQRSFSDLDPHQYMIPLARRRVAMDELHAYFKLPREDFST